MFVFLGILLSFILGGVGGHFFGWEGLLITLPASFFIGFGASAMQKLWG